MALEHFLIEIFGVACPTLLTYAATQHVAFEPLFTSVSRNTNDLYITLIPAAVYLLFRGYFAFIMAGACKVPTFYRYYLTSFLVIMSILAPFFHPTLQSNLTSLYNMYFAELMKVLYDASEPEVLKAVQFGMKVFCLLCGWFAVLFILELILRVVFLLLRTIYKAVVTAVFGKSSQKISAIEISSETEKQKEE